MKKDEQHIDAFIRKHKEAFDDREAPMHIWDKVEERLPVHAKTRSIRLYQWISAAAVALVLILSGVIAGMYISKPDYTNTAEYQDFQKAELYYAAQMDQKMEALQQRKEDPMVKQDLEQLDVVYEELRAQLMHSDNPSKKPIIDAMITNYQTRIAILETVLEKLSESEEYLKTQESNEEAYDTL